MQILFLSDKCAENRVIVSEEKYNKTLLQNLLERR
jgi:hypothetical protein